MRIHYISYGIYETGGYRHEKTLFDSLSHYLGQTQEITARLFRKNKLFTHVFGYLELLFWSFLRSNADINIVTARTAIPAILRNLYNKKEVWIVLHNFDPNDGKSALMKWYYQRLFFILNKSKHNRFKVIAVSHFWENYFRDITKVPHVYLFPNLFDTTFYLDFQQKKKNNWVHLGQFSSKNDLEILALSIKLSSDGYYCYFSTLNTEEARPHNGSFDIICFKDFTEYLDHMAQSCCTLALTKINEGWNRMAHESILVGTPVIGYMRAGLGDLLKESNSMAVKNIDEAYTCIRESLWILPDKRFMEAYDIKNADKYLKPLCNS